MSYLLKPKNYKPILNLQQTELGIARIKELFQSNLSTELCLRRVTAPLFVLKGTGINDDLNGVERPVEFPIKEMGEMKAEVVQSLAKWKRLTLAAYEVEPGRGIYADMNAIRPDEELGNLHSLYVEQWDWERVLAAEERNVDYLKKVVRKIYAALLRVEYSVSEIFPQIQPILPPEITFIHAEELRQMFPNLTPKERETELVKKHKAIFVIGIGGALGDGKKHDGRAPDYDDWSTEGYKNYPGLNGDIVLWNPVLEIAFELSSMGIRVDKTALIRQLDLEGKTERKDLYFHKRLIEGSLPFSIGGGIGQSRLCMFLLRKAHIGEIQSSIWPAQMYKDCEKQNIILI